MAAILILHFKDNQDTFDCLDSLIEAKSVVPFDTYVISVQSTQTDKLANHPLKPIVINETINRGFAGANNVMIQKALADGHQEIILLNNDTTVTKDFLPPLLAQLKHSDVGMVSPKIYFSKGREYHKDRYQANELGHVIWYMGGILDWKNVYGSHFAVDEVDHGQFETAAETDFTTGCCVAITKATIDVIGLMDENYFLYYEDADWSMKAKAAGLKNLVEPHSVIYHKNAGSTGGAGSPLHMYYQTRNRIYFGLKYAPLRTKAHLIKNALRDSQAADPVVRGASLDALTFQMGFRPVPKVEK